MNLTDRLHDLAASGGAAGSGVCTTGPFVATARVLAGRVADGSNAGMAFTFARPDVATDIAQSFPWAQRLFVVAHSYMPEAGTPRRRPGRARVARFATRDHYEDLESILEAVTIALLGDGFRAEWLRDDSRLVDRAAAVRAGVGWWGKNSMVLMPGKGPWVLLGSVVTDAPLEVSPPMTRSCGSCSACLPACPTGALVSPGVLDARLCLAHWLQAPGVIPSELRDAVGDRVYGCDDCIEACPPGSRILESAGQVSAVDLLDLLATDDHGLLEDHAHFYIPDRRARYLRRNALVALGNSGPVAGAVAVLAGYVGHPDWLLRLHAAWALSRIGGRDAEAVLVAASAEEDDRRVQAEIDEALDHL